MRTRGFTLVELAVVMAIFIFITTGAIGIFISIVNYQRQMLLEQELLNQTSYVVEYVSKALRMATVDENGNCLGQPGYFYLLTRPDAETGFYRGIKFINATDNYACEEIYLDTYSLGGSGDNFNAFVLKEKKAYPPYEPVSDENSVALTSEKFQVSSLRFGINGATGRVGETYYASQADAQQPRVTFFLEVRALSGSDQITRKIQTTISLRKLNTQ